jgi:hypothetical protein
MDRRKFLTGLVAVTAVGVSNPSVAATEIPKVPLSESAIFALPQLVKEGEVLSYNPVTTPYMVFRLEVKDFIETNKSEMACTIRSYASSNKSDIRFDCAKNVDEYYIKNCKFFDNPTFDMKNMTFDDHAMRFALTSTGNSIAKETRRGAGNHIILHPDRAQQARDLGYTSSRPFQNMVERDWMPLNEVFVFYRGNNQWDNPGILFHNGNLVLPDGFSYGRRVKFKN